MASLRVGIIGFGAIGSAVGAAIAAGDAGKADLVGILVRDKEKHGQNSPQLASLFTDDIEAFLASRADLVIEAAGQPALREYGRRILEQRADLLVTSMGAFTDEPFYYELIAAAEANNRRLFLASGALPAVDWLASVAPAGVRHVAITQSKPVNSWRQTPAVDMIDLDQLTEPTRFFQGSAREAASRFPKSSNITAMLALITAGLDETNVSLVADPVSDDMLMSVEFDGEAGRLKVERQGTPSALNPSTGADVPLNIIKAVRNLTGTLSFGP